jgi:transglutaminase-like putative cysteine protease
MNEYLIPTPAIDSDHPQVAGKARELVSGLSDPIEKARVIFYFVRDRIKYDMFVDILTFEEYRASRTLERGGGFCVMKAVLLAALGRAAGIPSRLGFADIINHRAPEYVVKAMGTNLFTYHGFAEFLLNGRWVKATPAFDLQLCRKNRIIPVEFDGVNDAMLPERGLDGKLHIEYVKSHGFFADLPHETIVETYVRIYGHMAMDAWQETYKQHMNGNK